MSASLTVALQVRITPPMQGREICALPELAGLNPENLIQTRTAGNPGVKTIPCAKIHKS